MLEKIESLTKILNLKEGNLIFQHDYKNDICSFGIFLGFIYKDDINFRLSLSIKNDTQKEWLEEISTSEKPSILIYELGIINVRKDKALTFFNANLEENYIKEKIKDFNDGNFYKESFKIYKLYNSKFNFYFSSDIYSTNLDIFLTKAENNKLIKLNDYISTKEFFNILINHYKNFEKNKQLVDKNDVFKIFVNEKILKQKKIYNYLICIGHTRWNLEKYYIDLGEMEEKDIISFVQTQKSDWLYNFRNRANVEATLVSPTNLYLVNPNLNLFNDEDYEVLSKCILEYPKR